MTLEGPGSDSTAQQHVSDGYFETRFARIEGRDRIWQVICRYLERYLPASGSVLDLGAGYCSFVNNVRARDKHAVDIFPGFVRDAAPDVRAVVGPSWNLSHLADGALDAVFSSNMLEHLTRSEVQATLNEVRRVLKPGGRLIIVQPNYRYCAREYFDDYTHQSVFSHVSLADLLTSIGFRVDVVIARFMPLTMKSRLPHWPWAVALYLRLPYRPLAKQMLVVASR